MSYCRFSSDNFMCDVYVYEDCYGGWTTHVAGNKGAWRTLPPWPMWAYPSFGQTYNSATRSVDYPSPLRKAAGSVIFGFIARWEQLRMWMLDRIPRRKITLPHAGQRFKDGTPKECADRLIELRSIGYNVPQYAIDSLLREELEIINAP